jgi:hypothetical protein
VKKTTTIVATLTLHALAFQERNGIWEINLMPKFLAKLEYVFVSFLAYQFFPLLLLPHFSRHALYILCLGQPTFLFVNRGHMKNSISTSGHTGL